MTADESAPHAIAKTLAALGHPARLSIYRLIMKAGCNGLNVGTIAAALDMPPSTLAHHLSTLCASGLIHQERRGREIVNQVDFKLMERTVRFLTDECCSGPPLALHAEARSFHPGCGPSEDAR